MDETFGALLSQFRKKKHLSQENIECRNIGLSLSYIAKIEQGHRGYRKDKPKSKSLSRKQVWHLVKKLELWPPDCDIFLEAAGLSRDRTAEEELDIQSNFIFQELWVFARIILDPDPIWYKVVANNIKKGVKYRYFTSTDTTFQSLLQKLKRENNIKDDDLKKHLECILLPEELFIANFAIYYKSRGDLYCCGTKTTLGKADSFYTIHTSEADRLYQWLSDWRERINTGLNIPLSAVRRIYPDISLTRFGPKEQ